MNEIGVISWNVKGDSASADGKGPIRVDDLQNYLPYFEKASLPVHILCFQETSGAGGSLMPYLQSKKYQCWTVQEGLKAGMHYLFALNTDLFSCSAPPEQVPISYPLYTGSTLRYPALAKLKNKDGTATALYTFHAPLDGALTDSLESFSKIVTDAAASGKYKSIYVAGDLNVTTADTIYVPSLGRSVNLLNRLFPGCSGASNHLDHIFRWPEVSLKKVYGQSYKTSSDHMLLYTKFITD